MLRQAAFLLVFILLLPFAALAQNETDEDASIAEISADSSDDKGFLTRMLQSRLSGTGRTVVIDGFRGALSSRATFDRIEISDAEGPWLTLHDGAIQWNRAALLRGRVQVGELTAERIEIPRPPASGEKEERVRAEAQSFNLPELPVGIHIEQIDANSVMLGSALIGEDAEITISGSMSLAGGEGAADVVISRIDGKKGDFTFNGSFDNDTRELNIDLLLDEDANGIFSRIAGLQGQPAVNAEIQGSGPLSAFSSNVRLATDGVERVTGQMSFDAAEGPDGASGNSFTLEVNGDIASLLPPRNRDFFGSNTQISAQGWRADTGRFEVESLSFDTDALKINGRLATNDQNAPRMLDLVVDFGQEAGAQSLPVTLPFTDPPVTVLSGKLAIGYDASTGSEWSLDGWVTELDSNQTRFARLDLDGGGQVALSEDQSLDQITGNIGFDANGISLVNEDFQTAVGEEIQGATSFDFVPGQVIEFTEMQVTGKDYSLNGSVTFDGLGSGIVISAPSIVAAHDDLSNLSALAGRSLSGRAEANLTGYYQVLTSAFDLQGNITGTDITVENQYLDRLLAGDSTIDISAGRTEEGTQLRELAINAQQISLTADGTITADRMDLSADFNMPTLADLDAGLEGALNAHAELSGPIGSRAVSLTGQATGLKTGIAALDGAFAGETDLTAAIDETSEGAFRLTDLTLDNNQLTLDGEGTISGSDLDADFQFNFSDLGALGEQFAGMLNANAQIRSEGGARIVTLTGTGTDIAAGQANLDAALSGQTRITARAEQRDGVISVSDVQIQNDQLSATASGQIAGADTQAQARIEIPALAALGRGWQGSLNADATLTQGEDGTRNIRVDGVGQDIALGQQNVDDALDGQTDITLLAQQTPDGMLRLESLDVVNGQLTANASGQIQDGAIDGQATAQIANLSALGQGWSGSLNADAQISTDDAGTRRIVVDGSGENIRLGQAQADAALTGTTTIDIVAEQAADGALRIERANVTNDQLEATAQGEIGEAGTNATARVSVNQLASLGLGLQGALNIDARLADTGDGARRLTIDGQGENLALGQQGTGGTLTGTTDIDVSAVQRDGTYTIERALLTNNQTRINAEGVIAPTGTDASAEIEISDLSALGLGMSGAVSADATLQDDASGARAFTVEGTATDLALRQAGADRALAGETRFVARGTQQDGLISVETAQVDNLDLSAEASGRYGEGQTDLTATIQAEDLAFLGGGVGGSLDADATIRDSDEGRRYDVTGQAQDLRVGNAQADGALAGETRFVARAVQNGSRITIDRLDAENPQVTLSGQGTLGGGGTSFTADAAARDLSFLGPQFGGSVQANAQLRDRGGVQQFEITGTASDLAVGVAQLDGAFAGATSFSATGTRNGGLIMLDQATASNARMNASASGVYGEGRTDLTAGLDVSTLSFVMPGFNGSVNATAQVLDQADGRRITAQATANGLSMGNDRVDPLLAGQTRVEFAALQTANGLIIQRVDARNNQIQLVADGNPAQALNIDARLANLAPLAPGIEGPAQAVGTVQQTPDGTRMDIAVTGPGGIRAQIDGTLAGEATNLRMSGIGDAAAVNGLLRTRSVAGPVDFDIRMQGTPGLNALTGEVNLRDGRLAEPRIGLSVDRLNLTARLAEGLINLDLDGGIQAGGAIAVDGAVDLRSGSPILDLTARLNRAVIRDPSLYELTADGTVSVSGVAADGPLVSGTINILEAEFRIPSTGLGGAQAIPDMIHVNDSWQAAATRAKAGLEPYGSLAAQNADLGGPAATPPATPARFDLTINAPNQIFVRGRGVDAELGGSMRLTGDAHTPVPVGHLSLIRGRVDLLGKRFDLSEGLVELQGSLIPVIRLVARHQEDDITISIIIDGEVREPDITFESDPELPEEEVLSYLLFGQGLDEISALQAAQLANALAVLAGRGGIGVVGNIRDATGLDDLDMTVDDDGSVAVRAGKYLTRNIYTDVELDDEGKTQINLNLDVTDSVTARGSADSDGESTLGLYYERDY
ncbi:translocation/assembly module TamB domain-containing protein [Paracoccus aerodenitrificans]|uniref:translocation/assembly module TamB domain-containing protein n=1 Tax=Paracoccus aerodenitrificans TaxID=3017781 RepID=UPI0022F1371C|nr:translocation/assembly module TamB domain-containing protein [Paracoccus aerodenitrificans]WBU63844.1 translocation/assembly module TamB domain-containing protein [Paracoccus aerodenitrificans]